MITCRGCNKELDNCTCDVLTTGKPTEADVSLIKIIELVDELEQQDIRIKDLELINASHRIENGELRERIKELEELMPTKEEAQRMIDCLPLDDKKYWEHCIGWEDEFEIFHNLNTKLQKIIGE
jgi:hypothetical protein